MGFFKKQLLKVIEMTDSDPSAIVTRFVMDDRYAIMRGSQLVVREAQEAIFVYQGKIADVFPAGRYRLETDNLPFLTKLCNWKYAFENPFVGEVYFVSTKQFAAQKWGTSNPIMMRDADFGVVRIRGYGIYSFRVKEPETLLRELLGSLKTFKTADIQDLLKKNILSSITEAIADSKIPALDLATSYSKLSQITKNCLSPKFEELGLKLTDLTVENISLPEEVEKMLDTRTSMGVMGDKMATFTQYQAAHAIRDAAKNPSGGAVGAGIGVGAGLGLGGMMTQTINQTLAQGDQPKAVSTAECPKCHHKCKAGAKFCPECGSKIEVETFNCPGCKAKIKEGAKFCPECGIKLKEAACPKCKAKVKPGAKFCPECGERL